MSAAGPVSDFSLGAVFALCALLLPAGVVRDIFFNLAFAAYVGGFFNLNPFIERDGYHMLVDWLNEPGLRRRAKEQLERRLGGGKALDGLAGARALLALGARLVGAGGVLRDRRCRCATRRSSSRSPDSKAVVYGVMGTLWVAFFLPVFFVLGKPLWQRIRD